MNETLIAAIHGQNVLEFIYDAQPRVVHPHALYQARNGNTLLHAWQIDGQSNSRILPCWGNFDLTAIVDLNVSPLTFRQAQPDYNRSRFRRVLASV